MANDFARTKANRENIYSTVNSLSLFAPEENAASAGERPPGIGVKQKFDTRRQVRQVPA